jgi:hypothetical protein
MEVLNHSCFLQVLEFILEDVVFTVGEVITFITGLFRTIRVLMIVPFDDRNESQCKDAVTDAVPSAHKVDPEVAPDPKRGNLSGPRHWHNWQSLSEMQPHPSCHRWRDYLIRGGDSTEFLSTRTRRPVERRMRFEIP